MIVTRSVFVTLLAWLAWQPLHAEALRSVEIVGLFKGRAIVRESSGVHTLRVGESTPNGVQLVSADSREAVLAYAGQRVRLGLSTRMTAQFRPVEVREVSIPRDDQGHYRVRGTINGLGADLLVDTGATVVTLSSRHARRLGVDWQHSDRVGRFNTAMGVTEARFVRLGEVAVGQIAQNDVEAVVIEGDYPEMILLGMSFLNGVKLEDSNGVLRLTR